MELGSSEPTPEPAPSPPATEPPPTHDSLAHVEVPAEPEPLRERLIAAARIGAVGGLGVGFVGFLLASVAWAPSSGFDEELGAVINTRSSLTWGLALAGVLFGSISAAASRAFLARSKPGMTLRNSSTSTAVAGALAGLLVGMAAGTVLNSGVAAPVEAAEGLARISVIAAMAVILFAGVLLGMGASVAAQLIGVPLGTSEVEEADIDTMRGRLRAAVSIPSAAAIILIALVIPFAWALIYAQHLASGFGVVVAVVTSLGILTFATLAGNRPNTRITLGESLVALGSLALIVVLLLAVLAARGPARSSGPGGTVEILAKEDLTFDATEWTVSEGDVTLVYRDEGQIVHTLLIEGLEEGFELRVAQPGEVDTGVVNLHPGTYTLFCGIKGHREAGMEGTLSVAAAAEEGG